MRRSLFVISTLATLGAVPLAAQQVRILSPSRTRVVATNVEDDGRAMIGVSTSSGTKRDTLGLLVSSVTEGGPAEKAGINEGDRIQSVNGVSLKVSRDDAGDDEMGGIMQRRLSREIGKVKAGDDVTLTVWQGGAVKTIKVKTVAADELNPRRVTLKRADERAVIGIGFGLTGSKRDTAGVFVNSVTEDGPADKAGIVEGDRLAAVNGVSLKVSKEDMEDGWASSSRLNRLSREIAKAKPGDVVELTVVSGGRSRTVKVTTVKASSLKGNEGGFSYFFRTPEAPMAAMAPMPPMPPMAGMLQRTPVPPRAPMAPRAPTIRWRTFDDDGDVDIDIGAAMGDVRREVERALSEELPRARRQLQDELPQMRMQLREGLDRMREELTAAKVRARTTGIRM